MAMTRDAEMRRFLTMCLALSAERDREARLLTIPDENDFQTRTGRGAVFALY